MTLAAHTSKSSADFQATPSTDDLQGLRDCLTYLRNEALAAKQEVVALHLLIAIQELENLPRFPQKQPTSENG
ncbi:MAG: hypothetical protein CMF31_04150 [Kordiimonas sp.]|nr:hypothetical protein [Kordiimonas sp.]|tara:strand:+ start:520 stop:738 length:219 start_codon:yes stop_codon:yes gene_type:complete